MHQLQSFDPCVVVSCFFFSKAEYPDLGRPMDNSVLIFELNSLSGSCEERGGTGQLVLLQGALVRDEQDVAPTILLAERLKRL